MPGERQKPAGTARRGRPAKHEPVPLAAGAVVADDPPSAPAAFNGGRLGPPARDAWDAFWSTAQAKSVDVSDLPQLRHWVRLVHQRSVVWRRFARDMFVEGYNGQPVLNPLFRVLQTVDAEIASIAEQFGMTPRARFRLGVAAGEAKLTADQVMASLQDEDAGGESMPEFNG